MSALGPKLIDPNSITKTWGEKEILAPGIVVYKNVLKKEIDIPNKLESVLMSTSNPYKWREATVGYGFKKPEYRDCVDFKFRKDDLHNTDNGTEILKDMWQECYDAMSEAVKDYCMMYNITELQYWEVMNFIRYHEGQHFEEHTDIAGVIIEPVGGNMGVVIPQNGFLKELKEYLQTKGALLIADEVMTGFRSKFGGAQELLGAEADITCLGKVIGGGFPVGAYGARNEIMEFVAPLGGMYQAGTLSGNPIAMAGGISTLKELKRQNPYKDFEKTASFLERALLAAAKENGIELQVNRFGSMINPFFTKTKVVDFKTAQTSDTNKFKIFFWKMMENGVFLPPSQFEHLQLVLNSSTKYIL